LPFSVLTVVVDLATTQAQPATQQGMYLITFPFLHFVRKKAPTHLTQPLTTEGERRQSGLHLLENVAARDHHVDLDHRENDDGVFNVFVMNIEGATYTITGLKATTTVNEFVQLVSCETGIPADKIKLVIMQS